MKKLNKAIALLFTLCFPFLASAQDAEMADTMRSNGKIYVVVAIALVILIGLIGYLVFIDKKVSGLEERITKKD
ncbi:MAG: CcmD family protein [Bacteroidetes bacterium]|nr:CcmD family protein [Bacteroidota bacterium]